MMEIRTQSSLTPGQIRDELICILDFMNENDPLSFMYGFGCEGTETQYQEVAIKREDLLKSLDEATRAGLFFYGGSDVWITSRPSDSSVVRTEVCLCHEADIRFTSLDRGLLEKIQTRWLAKQWKVYRRIEDQGEWSEP